MRLWDEGVTASTDPRGFGLRSGLNKNSNNNNNIEKGIYSDIFRESESHFKFGLGKLFRLWKFLKVVLPCVISGL